MQELRRLIVLLRPRSYSRWWTVWMAEPLQWFNHSTVLTTWYRRHHQDDDAVANSMLAPGVCIGTIHTWC